MGKKKKCNCFESNSEANLSFIECEVLNVCPTSPFDQNMI